MRGVSKFTERDRRDLFSETARAMGMTPAIAEKDFWVTWVLGEVFAHAALAELLRFKGGTSLSKVYGLIERFSEDIDLVLDWQQLGADDPLAARSRSSQVRLNETMNSQARDFIASDLLEMIASAVAPTCRVSMDPTDGHVIEVFWGYWVSCGVAT